MDRDVVDEIDLAVARAEGHLAGLVEARGLLTAMPLSRQDEMLVAITHVEARVERPTPERSPGPLVATESTSRPKDKPTDAALRDKMVQSLIKDGPCTRAKLADRVGTSAFIVTRLVDHPWFSLEYGKVTLTTEGFASVKKDEN